MRTVAIITIFIWYLLCINVYILTFGLIDQFASKLLYLWPAFITLFYCSIDIYRGIRGFYHKCFLSLCLSGIGGNFLIMILYFQFGISNYLLRFVIFNGVSLITSVFIIISGSRHNLFKTENLDNT